MSKMEPMTWYGRYLSEHARCNQLQQENERLRNFLMRKAAVASVSADNDKYQVGISIAEIDAILKDNSTPTQKGGE